MSVAGTVLPFSVDRDFRPVHVDYHPLGLRSIHGLRLAVSSRLIRLRPSRFRLGPAPQSRTNADAKATLPHDPRSSRNRFNRNPARDRQEYFRSGMEIGRSSLRSGRTLARYFCTRVSRIEQRQHCGSRIFYFWPAERNRWHGSWLLHGFTKLRKRELEFRIWSLRCDSG